MGQSSLTPAFPQLLFSCHHSFVSGLLTFINCVSVRLAMRIQTIFTSAKLMALVVLIMAGFFHFANGKLHGLYRIFFSVVILNFLRPLLMVILSFLRLFLKTIKAFFNVELKAFEVHF